ncbi:hypothetical protein [Sulfurovum sp.]|uniref:hypothetical protein n=1 Tax=Sulfurovum sp. TaxID=1969726 RepID=UPI0025CC63D4|nr:hypothetical protein [Sulfurovum sp.]
MKLHIKALFFSTMLIFAFSPHALARKVNMEAIHAMEIKLANLEVDISKKKIQLVQREEKLNEMKVKSLSSTKIDRKNMALKLAEIESALAKDKLLLAEREVKLYEMKVALLKQKQQ